MPYTPTAIPDVLIHEAKVFGDSRGFFFESFNAKDFAQVTGPNFEYEQDKRGCSSKGVLRGLLNQLQQAQGKLLLAARSAIWAVPVDLHCNSLTYGRWVKIERRVHKRLPRWILPGFAHGFRALSEQAEFVYEDTYFCAPTHERYTAVNDPDIAIDSLLSDYIAFDRDQQGYILEQAETYA